MSSINLIAPAFSVNEMWCSMSIGHFTSASFWLSSTTTAPFNNRDKRPFFLSVVCKMRFLIIPNSLLLPLQVHILRFGVWANKEGHYFRNLDMCLSEPIQCLCMQMAIFRPVLIKPLIITRCKLIHVRVAPWSALYRLVSPHPLLSNLRMKFIMINHIMCISVLNSLGFAEREG